MQYMSTKYKHDTNWNDRRCRSEPNCSVSKKQNAIETATYGAELVAMHFERDLTESICDNCTEDQTKDHKRLAKTTSIQTPMWAKKHKSVNYHTIQESQSQ